MMKHIQNSSKFTNYYGTTKSSRKFTLKGRRPKPNNLKNRTPGSGAYPIYTDFVTHPNTKQKGWIFSKAEKKISKSVKRHKNALFFDEPPSSQKYNKTLLGDEGPGVGPGSYNTYNGGIGTGFGPPPPLNRRLNRTMDYDTMSKDNREKRREVLYENMKLRKIRGVSFGKAKRQDLSIVDPEVEVGPATYNIKSTVAQLQPWETHTKKNNMFNGEHRK